MKRVRSFYRKLKNTNPTLVNRYVLTTILFFVWVVFLDQNSILSQYDDNLQLIEAKKNKLFYMKKLKETKYNLDLLLSDNEHVEQFARENFWMKKPNEDLFIIAEKSEKPVE